MQYTSSSFICMWMRVVCFRLKFSIPTICCGECSGFHFQQIHLIVKMWRNKNQSNGCKITFAKAALNHFLKMHQKWNENVINLYFIYVIIIIEMSIILFKRKFHSWFLSLCVRVVRFARNLANKLIPILYSLSQPKAAHKSNVRQSFLHWTCMDLKVKWIFLS